MFKSFEEIFGNKKQPQVAEFDDAVLGKLRLTEEGWWEANVAIAGKRIGFTIGGDMEPNSVLIAHARDIVQSFAEFETMIAAFLAKEGRRMNMTRDQIKNLEIEGVMLCWSQRPNDGMIYFRGLEDIGVWRCDYVDRKPKGLGFDS